MSQQSEAAAVETAAKIIMGSRKLPRPGSTEAVYLASKLNNKLHKQLHREVYGSWWRRFVRWMLWA